MDTYNFSGDTPQPLVQNSAAYEWDSVDPALTPTMAVDDNVASFIGRTDNLGR